MTEELNGNVQRGSRFRLCPPLGRKSGFPSPRPTRSSIMIRSC